MSTNSFTPEPETLFYANSLVYFTKTVGVGDTAVAVRERDRSYESSVMQCVAVDDRVVVADVYGSHFGDRRIMLLRANYKFWPVGPEVAKAIGIFTAQQETLTQDAK